MLLAQAHATAQTFQELHAFGGLDGIDPEGALIQATDGNFYGTTSSGGQWNDGTVFRMSPDGTLTTLVSFNSTNGSSPYGGLLQARDGNLYGTTFSSCCGTSGTLFRIRLSDGSFTPLGAWVTDAGYDSPWYYGGGPIGDLAQGADGYLYGITQDDGSIFKVSTNGTGFQTLYTFTYGTSVGYSPSGPLLLASDGNFYGVCADGGANDKGTVYKMTPGGTVSALAAFYEGQWPNLQAIYPSSRLLQTSDGNFYGAAEGGNDGASVFKMTPDGALTTFGCDYDTGGAGPNGVIQANDGNFYGTMQNGGVSFHLGSLGWVFRMTPDGVFSEVLSFTGGPPYPGANPYAGLVQGSDGNLYGTTGNYGSHGNGNVFCIIMPGPLLSSTQAGSQLVLSWRTNYVGFNLQSSPYASTSNWTVCTNLPVIIGGQYVITNPISATAAFFRLKK